MKLRAVLIKNIVDNRLIQIYTNYRHKNEMSIMMQGSASDLMRVLSQHYMDMEYERCFYGRDGTVSVFIKVGDNNVIEVTD